MLVFANGLLPPEEKGTRGAHGALLVLEYPEHKAARHTPGAAIASQRPEELLLGSTGHLTPSGCNHWALPVFHPALSLALDQLRNGRRFADSWVCSGSPRGRCDELAENFYVLRGYT